MGERQGSGAQWGRRGSIVGRGKVFGVQELDSGGPPRARSSVCRADELGSEGFVYRYMYVDGVMLNTTHRKPHAQEVRLGDMVTSQLG